MNAQIVGQTDKQMDGMTDGSWMDEQTDGWKDGRTDRQTAGWKEITYCIVRKAMAEIHRKENDEDKHKNEIDQKEKKMWV